jgi:RNA polymerase sigma-70 factor (ECF subfamily)
MDLLGCSRSYEFDESYLCALRARDVETEAHFVRYFTPLLRITLRRRMCRPDQIDDVVHSTFLRVLQRIRFGAAIDQPKSLGAFVYSVCKNVSLETYRIDKRYEALEELAIDPPDTAVAPDEDLVRQETRSKVRQILALLPLRDRDLLRSVFFEQRDKDEICRELGVTRDYLRVLVCRAKEQFQNRYEREESQPAKPRVGPSSLVPSGTNAYSRKEIIGSIRVRRGRWGDSQPRAQRKPSARE